MIVEPPKTVAAARRTVTADTLAVAPSVLGLALAEPWRRLAGMLVDLLAVAVLSFLSGPVLGLATGTMLTVLLGNSREAPLALKIGRVVCRLLGGFVVVLSLFSLGHVSFFRRDGVSLDVFTGRAPSAAMK